MKGSWLGSSTRVASNDSGLVFVQKLPGTVTSSMGRLWDFPGKQQASKGEYAMAVMHDRKPAKTTYDPESGVDVTKPSIDASHSMACI